MDSFVNEGGFSPVAERLTGVVTKRVLCKSSVPFNMAYLVYL